MKEHTYYEVGNVNADGIADENDHHDNDDDEDDDEEGGDDGEDNVPGGVAGVAFTSCIRGTASCSRHCRRGSLSISSCH